MKALIKLTTFATLIKVRDINMGKTQNEDKQNKKHSIEKYLKNDQHRTTKNPEVNEGDRK